MSHLHSLQMNNKLCKLSALMLQKPFYNGIGYGELIASTDISFPSETKSHNWNRCQVERGINTVYNRPIVQKRQIILLKYYTILP